MSPVTRNILVNFLGKGWSALMAVAFVPLYIRFLGIEAYGLIGFFAILQAAANLLDMGLSPTLNRELARRSAQAGTADETRDLVRTLEIVYWAIGVVIAAGVAALAPYLAAHWVRATSLDVSTVRHGVTIMGLVLAMQWPLSFYSGGLMGLQRQVLWNGINAAASTFRGVGAVFILWKVSPTIQAYFYWQIAGFALHTLLATAALWRNLPGTRAARVRPGLLLSIRRFAAGMTAISVVTFLLMQLDKVILSRILPLDLFGYYTLASVVSLSLYYLILPVFDALFPRFSQLAYLGDEPALRSLYHGSSQIMAVVILPIAAVLAFCSADALLVWTGNPVTVANTHTLVTILVGGTALNGLMNMPYALQLAHGWTKLTLLTNIVAVVLLVPLMIVLALRYKGVGAAIVWLLLNVGYVLVMPHIIHRRLLRGEKARWYLQDVALPLAVSTAAVAAGRSLLLAHRETSRPALLVSLAALYGLALILTAIATPFTRRRALGFLRGRTEGTRALRVMTQEDPARHPGLVDESRR